MRWPPRRREILDLPVPLDHPVPATLAWVAERSGLRIVQMRLFNLDAVEWALAARGFRREERRISGEGLVAGRAARAGEPPRWTSRVLPRIRRRFPGGRFQLLATPAP
jgi:hypothetical protein